MALTLAKSVLFKNDLNNALYGTNAIIEAITNNII